MVPTIYCHFYLDDTTDDPLPLNHEESNFEEDYNKDFDEYQNESDVDI
jgi:hypothetical protein